MKATVGHGVVIKKEASAEGGGGEAAFLVL